MFSITPMIGMCVFLQKVSSLTTSPTATAFKTQWMNTLYNLKVENVFQQIIEETYYRVNQLSVLVQAHCYLSLFDFSYLPNVFLFYWFTIFFKSYLLLFLLILISIQLTLGEVYEIQFYVIKFVCDFDVEAGQWFPQTE